MKLYELSLGNVRRHIAAADHEDAYKQGTDPTRHPDLCYLPFEVHEVTVPGYEIYLQEPPLEPAADEFDDMDRDALKAWLEERGIEYVPQWGDKRLRELARDSSPAKDVE